MKKHALIAIKVYQKIFSPDKGFLRFMYPNNRGYCVMYPSCSEYMELAIEKYGLISGVRRGIGRITRCHPYQKKLIDPP